MIPGMRLAYLALSLAVAPLAACSTEAHVVTNPTFADVRAVFKTSCVFSSCHAASAHMGGLDLEIDPYDGLINATPSNKAAKAEGWKRVVPGDDAKSFLVFKLALPGASDPDYGDRMPDVTGEPLPSDEIDLVRRWVQQGAHGDLPDGGTSDGASPDGATPADAD
jgi:hypothetical protein